MPGKNKDRRCKDCGDSLTGVWMNYCTRCRSRRIRENNAIKKALNPEDPNKCVDCGTELWGKYAKRCRSCAEKENDRLRNERYSHSWWNTAPPPTGLPICSE